MPVYLREKKARPVGPQGFRQSGKSLRGLQDWGAGAAGRTDLGPGAHPGKILIKIEVGEGNPLFFSSLGQKQPWRPLAQPSGAGLRPDTRQEPPTAPPGLGGGTRT